MHPGGQRVEIKQPVKKATKKAADAGPKKTIKKEPKKTAAITPKKVKRVEEDDMTKSPAAKKAADAAPRKRVQDASESPTKKKTKKAESLPPPSEASDTTEDNAVEADHSVDATTLADDDREGDALALSNFRLSGESLSALQKRGAAALSDPGCHLRPRL